MQRRISQLAWGIALILATRCKRSFREVLHEGVIDFARDISNAEYRDVLAAAFAVRAAPVTNF
jgi:hypothetical protein